MSRKLPFTAEFQAKALVLMVDEYDTLNELDIKPEYFDDPICAEISQVIVDLKKEYAGPITMSLLEERLREDGEDEHLLYYMERLELAKKSFPESERSYIIKNLTEFVKYQAVKSALSQSVDKLRQHDLSAVESVMGKAFEIGKVSGSIGLRYFSDIGSRLSRRRYRKSGIRTLIVELDNFLENKGLNFQELGVVMAPTKRGKSFFLAHVTKAAIVQKFKVVYYTFEMSEDRIADRLDAAFAGINLSELQSSPVVIMKRLQEFGKKYGEALIIKHFPAKSCNTLKIRAHLRKLSMDKFIPHMIILDYADLMIASKGETDDRYYELGNVYVELLQLAQEKHVALWTASQSGRGAYSKELITLEDIAESYAKAMVADVIISLNQTPEEKAREAMRLFIAGSRQGQGGVVIPIYTNFKKGSFYRKG